MAQVRDPVCGMEIDEAAAAGRTDYEGRTWYFCSERCLTSFRANPVAYAHEPLEQHEPPFTTKGGITAPKFGSAGSGGAEYERLPEKHRKH